jgi:hypothetical protein
MGLSRQSEGVLRKLLASYSQALLTSNSVGKWLAKHVRPQFEPIPEPSGLRLANRVDLVDQIGRSGQNRVATCT